MARLNVLLYVQFPFLRLEGLTSVRQTPDKNALGCAVLPFA